MLLNLYETLVSLYAKAMFNNCQSVEILVFFRETLRLVSEPQVLVCALYWFHNPYMMNGVYFWKVLQWFQDRDIKEEILWLQVAKQHMSGSCEGQEDFSSWRNQDAFPLSASSSTNPAFLEIPWFTSKSLSWAFRRETNQTAELLQKYSAPLRKVTAHIITVLALSSFRAHFHSAQFPDRTGASFTLWMPPSDLADPPLTRNSYFEFSSLYLQLI